MGFDGFPAWLAGEDYNMALKELKLNNPKLALFYMQDAARIYKECGIEKPPGFDEKMQKIKDRVPAYI